MKYLARRPSPEKKEAEEAVEDTEMVTEETTESAEEVTEEAVKDTEKTHEQIILNIHIKGIENYPGELGVAVFEKKKDILFI
jgi:predicted amino acid racemase